MAASPVPDINELLHHSRGAYLREMPPGAQSLLSAGCAGLWYFDWIEKTYGPVREHLGIEYYSPKPPGLPANVTWIVNTVMDMSSVEDARCDLVFSGENLEHLWPEEVIGFYLEAARVLKTGGHLVVDSPNRDLTAPLNWSHPEHTIELTAAEAVRIATLAGFDVTAQRGIWLCRDRRSGEVLPFDPSVAVPGWTVTERLIAARDRPEDSFIWWVEAKRSDRKPDVEGVNAFMSDLFRRHWPERTQRFLSSPGFGRERAEGAEWIVAAPGQGGAALYGPYMPLRGGRHRVTWDLKSVVGAHGPVAVCEVMAGEAILCRRDVEPDAQQVAIEFDLPSMTFGLQFRCIATGQGSFSVRRGVEIETLMP